MSTLADELTNLYPDQADMRRVTFDAGIPERDLDLGDAPINDWHNILLDLCKRNKLERLIEVVQSLEEYPEKSEAMDFPKRKDHWFKPGSRSLSITI